MNNPNKLFPMFFTHKLAETKAFYVDQLGWKVSFDMDNYLQVRPDQIDGPELAFMKPDAMPGAKAFTGEGVVVSVPTKSADALHKSLSKKKVEITATDDKPWGWRSFYATDPNGLTLDFFHVVKEMPYQG